MPLMFAYVEFQDVNSVDCHVSYIARQLNRYIHDRFYWPEMGAKGILNHGFEYCWWHKENGTTLNLGFDMNPEALGWELAKLKSIFPGALRAQIFQPEYGIPKGAEIQRKDPDPLVVIPVRDNVVAIEDYLKKTA